MPPEQVAGNNGPLQLIELKLIRENPVALRSVNKQSEEYQGLVDSVRTHGVLNPILVREIRDPETGNVMYGLIDGLHRFSASSDAGKTHIPAHVKNMEDAAVLEAQVLANVHKVETRPVEYSKQLMRILGQNPLLTTAELSARLCKSPGWLNERLGLVKLTADIASLVDEGKVNLSNAYALAKLPTEEQPNFLDRAMTMSPQEFVPTVTGRVKEIRDAKRAGKDPNAVKEFTPVAHLRKVSELKDEMTNPQVGPILTKELKVTDPATAFKLGVEWALHMDPASIQVQKQRDAERKAELEEQKKKRKEERDKKKQEEAAATAAGVS